MISFLRGTVQSKLATSIILDVSGVGYELFLSTQALDLVPTEGSEMSLYTFLHVREDILQLYGFSALEEKELFTSLLSVGGIGPKVALSVLSTFSAESLKKAIMSGDVAAITRVPGLGKKGAERLILELRGKLALPELAENVTPEVSAAYSEARNALMSLGYTVAESKKALEGFNYSAGEVSAETLVKFALRNLSGVRVES